MLPVSKWRFRQAFGLLAKVQWSSAESWSRWLGFLTSGESFEPISDPDPLPNTPPEPIDPPEPAPIGTGLLQGLISGYFLLCVRFSEVTTAMRTVLLKLMQWIRIGPWEQRRSEKDTPETLAERGASMAALSGSRKIWLACDWYEPNQPGYADPMATQGETAKEKRLRWQRIWLSAFRPYWDRIQVIEVCDEPETDQELCTAVSELKLLLLDLGLSIKPISTTVGEGGAKILNLAKQEVDIVAIENYFSDPGKWNDRSGAEARAEKRRILNDLYSYVTQVCRKKCAVVVETYGRNPDKATGKPTLWNMHVLAAGLQETLLWIRERISDLQFVAFFSCGRKTGMCDADYPEIWNACVPQIEAFVEAKPFPNIPADPRPGGPHHLVFGRLMVKASSGPSTPSGKPSQMGVIVGEIWVHDKDGKRCPDNDFKAWKIKVIAQSNVDTTTCGPGKNSVTATGPFEFGAGEYHSSLGRRFVLQILRTPIGTPIYLSASLEHNGKTLTAAQKFLGNVVAQK